MTVGYLLSSFGVVVQGDIGGAEAVLKGVLGRASFALGSPGAGAVLGITQIGIALLLCRHFVLLMRKGLELATTSQARRLKSR